MNKARRLGVCQECLDFREVVDSICQQCREKLEKGEKIDEIETK